MNPWEPPKFKLLSRCCASFSTRETGRVTGESDPAKLIRTDCPGDASGCAGREDNQAGFASDRRMRERESWNDGD